MPRKDAHAMGEPLMSLTGRFPVSVVARIDAHAEAMRGAMPGLSIGRTDVLRSLVVQALDALYAPTAGGVTDIVTDTTVTDTSQLRRMLQEELRAFFAHAEVVIDAIRDKEAAQAATDEDEALEHIQTHTKEEHDEWLAEMHKQGRLLDIPLAAAVAKAAAKKRKAPAQPVTDTVTDTDAPQKPPRRRTRQAAPAD
jgi:hypothetical protein